MARETWKCPYADCKQECSRKWNLQRHITRSHGGEGNPVKNKSSADTAKSTWDIQDTANIFKNRYVSHPNSPYSLPAQYSPSTIKGFYSRSQIAKEENNKKGQEVKTTDELDPIDIAYQNLRSTRIETTRLKK